MVTHAIVLGPEFDTVTDDTEDSLMGSAGHQDTIHVIYDGVRLCAVRRDEPWFVGNQLFLLILQEGRNLPRRIAPDIMVYRSLALPNDPGSLAVALYGPPVLVIEVASPATALGNDVNLRDQNAKPQLYERIGVDEYLVFDPVGEMLGERIWARRRGPNGFVLWEPEGAPTAVGPGAGIAHSAFRSRRRVCSYACTTTRGGWYRSRWNLTRCSPRVNENLPRRTAASRSWKRNCGACAASSTPRSIGPR